MKPMVLVERDRFILLTLLMQIPVFAEFVLALEWPDSESGRANMRRRLAQLCREQLLVRHVAWAQTAANSSLFYAWTPGSLDPDFGPLAWELTKRWERLASKRVVFYTASELAGRHFGRRVRNPLKSISALSHEIGLGQVFMHYHLHLPLLASGWVPEDIIASSRGHGEKVLDAVIVDSQSRPALYVEYAGASYGASNGQRLREIHNDCKTRHAPYEVWTVAEGGLDDDR